ncbi:MAG: rRNA maturation RNase YbeY [Bacilli bacterium]|jgi:probable rRNA maturation factor|nr:rRNA maturation RNase YbeY [Acholeplasmataceae bacterium]
MIKTNIVNLPDFPFNGKKVIQRLARMVKKYEHVKGRHVLSVIFVSEEEMYQINKQYRGMDSSTDVISFAEVDNGFGELPYELGDIFVNVDRIKSQAKSYGHSELREFAFLILHGMLHLLGYDHQTENEEKQMFALQEEILNCLAIERK